MSSRCTMTCRESDMGGPDPLWNAHQKIAALVAERDAALGNAENNYARWAAVVAERDALLAPFQHIDALDWDYILNLMICNVRHPQDAQNIIWLEAMKALRAALSPSHVEGK